MSDIVDLITYLNQSGKAIPIQLTTATNATQFWLSFALAAVGSIFILFILWMFIQPIVSQIIIKYKLKKMQKITGRNILFIKHTDQTGLFGGGGMINSKTILQLNKALTKFKGQPFDLVLHTPGGEIFSSMFVSRILKSYPNAIRVMIPFYAMSGGTLLALSGNNDIYMTPISCLGPVDPQLGNLFRYGSAKAWDKIVKFKGKKAEDQSISFAMMGNQYTKSIAKYINNLLIEKLPNEKDRKKFVNFLTSGEVEHAYALTPHDLKDFKMKIKVLPAFVMNCLSKIITSPLYEGVYYSAIDEDNDNQSKIVVTNLDSKTIIKYDPYKYGDEND